MSATKSVSQAQREAHYRALASWMEGNPGRTFCGQADPEAYCGKPFVRGCDYHDYQWEIRHFAPEAEEPSPKPFDGALGGERR